MRNKDFWEKTAEKFGKNGIKAVCNPTAFGLRNIYGHLLQRTVLMPFLKNWTGLKVLDVGCGIGRWTLMLLELGADVVGIDISRNMICELKRRLRMKKGSYVRSRSLELVVCSVSDMPFRDCSFDACLSVTVLQHVTEEGEFGKAICELVRVCTENGGILVLEASPQVRKPTASDFPTVFRSTGDWTKTFRSVGLRIRNLKGVDPLHISSVLNQVVERRDRERRNIPIRII